MSEQEGGKIKVVDRRRFTDTGEVRPGWEPQPPTQSPQPSPPSSPPPRPKGPEPTPGGGPGRGAAPQFLELINDLAQQTVLLIEGAEGFPAQPAQAKRLIDYLGVLEEKTKGNLSQDESKALSNVIFQLRTLYVQRSR